MTNDEIIAQYQFILDALRAGKEIEWRSNSSEPWELFIPLSFFYPLWELRLKESPPSPREAWTRLVNADASTDSETLAAIVEGYVKRDETDDNLELAWRTFWETDHDGSENTFCRLALAEKILNAHFDGEPELVKPEAVEHNVGPAPTSDNPPFVVAWIAAEHEPLIGRLHIVWGDRESIQKPLPVVTLEVVKALENWRAMNESGTWKQRTPDRLLLDALTKGR